MNFTDDLKTYKLKLLSLQSIAGRGVLTPEEQVEAVSLGIRLAELVGGLSALNKKAYTLKELEAVFMQQPIPTLEKTERNFRHWVQCANYLGVLCERVGQWWERYRD